MTPGSPTHFELPADRVASSEPCRLLDVTLRDGGFAVDFAWPDGLPAAFVQQVSRLDVAIVELGYIGGLPELHGVGAMGTSADLTVEAVEACQAEGIGLAAMVHPSALDGRIDFARFRAAGLELVRFVYHESWRDGVAELARAASEVGLRVSVNLALASRYEPSTLLHEAEVIQRLIGPDLLYIADTCGALYPDDVSLLIGELFDRGAAPSVGFHAHDFMSLAFANSIAAVKAGATYVDGSIGGLGRSTGNLSTELWLASHDRSLLEPEALSRALDLVGKVQSHRPDRFFAALCGAMNLTPPEEDLLIEVASRRELAPRSVALALASRGDLAGLQLTDTIVLEAVDRAGG